MVNKKTVKQKVLIKTVNEVKAFYNIVMQLECDADVCQGRYTVDARSIMGLFSLDLDQPVTIRLYSTRFSEDELKEQEAKFLEKISEAGFAI